MVEKHEILRTSFHMDNMEEPLQFVHQQKVTDYEHNNISEISTNEQVEYISKHLENDRKSGFEITKPGLWRYRTFALGDDFYCVCFICHHAIIDGWSDASFNTELFNIYFSYPKLVIIL